jgi:hypothetical protein
MIEYRTLGPASWIYDICGLQKFKRCLAVVASAAIKDKEAVAARVVLVVAGDDAIADGIALGAGFAPLCQAVSWLANTWERREHSRYWTVCSGWPPGVVQAAAGRVALAGNGARAAASNKNAPTMWRQNSNLGGMIFLLGFAVKGFSF